MTVKISHTDALQTFFKEAAGFGNDNGNPRLKSIILRVLQDSAKLIEDLDISEDEFWKAVDYLNRLGGRSEAGLLVAGLGIEHFLDVLQDVKDEQVGLTGGTPRTIEGPLYVAGAPIFEGRRAWMTAARTVSARCCFCKARCSMPTAIRCPAPRSTCGRPILKARTRFLTRASLITTCAAVLSPTPRGRYRARSIVPSGYGCDPQGPTQECLDQLGRHGQRPAHGTSLSRPRPAAPDHSDQPIR